MRIVDLHCHAIPNEFVEALNKANAGITVGGRQASTGRRYFHDQKSGMTVSYTSNNHYNMESKLKDMDRFGVDVQAMSLALPSVDRVHESQATSLAKLANDTLHDLCSFDPERFVGLGILPFQNPEDAVEEVDRCVDSLGFKGFIIATNTNGEPLDSPKFTPIFERLSEKRIVLLLHPTIPIASNISQQYALDLLFGWPFDTSMAMARLVYGGVMSKFEDLKFVAAHSGGMIPFYRGRISYVREQHKKEIQTELKHHPLYYFRKFILDTAAFDSYALECAYNFVGSRGMVFGTDYPFGANDGRDVIRNAIKGVSGMRIGKSNRQKILSSNPNRLLGRQIGN